MYKKTRKYNSNIHIYEFNPNIERLSLEIGIPNKLERVSTIGKPKDGEEISCRTNAGFFNFNATSEHLGLLITEGLYYSPPSPVFIDIVFNKNKTLYIEHVKNVGNNLSLLQFNSIFACGSSFSLIQNGKINLENCGFFNHYLQRHPRTAIGQKQNGNIVLCVVDGRSLSSFGVTGRQLAQIMFDEGCVTATNFDGGGSSVMVLGKSVVSRPSDGRERSVGSAFVVYKKKSNANTRQYQTIRIGSRGEDVKEMQHLLNIKGFNAGVEDGIAGNITISALRRFQIQNKLIADGICGQKTWGMLLR
jgi:exopolysaccharide biosynthesis protein